KSLGYKDLIPRGGAEHQGDMPAKVGGTPADIDGNVKDRTRCHPHQLGLGKRWDLEMKPAENALPYRQRMIFLYKPNIDSVSAQHVFPINLGEEPSGIG